MIGWRKILLYYENNRIVLCFPMFFCKLKILRLVSSQTNILALNAFAEFAKQQVQSLASDTRDGTEFIFANNNHLLGKEFYV